MSYRLLEGGAGKRLLEGGVGARLLDAQIAQRRHFWRVLIFDRNNNLVDIPQADIEEFSFKLVLNGGSQTGQLIFVRDFNKIGALGPGYQVLIWIWTEGSTMPVDPYYSGIVIDELDQEQLDARGRITVNMKGDSALLDAAVVTSTVTGGIGGATPMPDAASYLNVLIPTYQPPSFVAPSIPGAMFQLWPLQFDGTALSACIDTVVKQSVDSNNHTFIWFVKTNHLLQRQVVVELDLNPNWNTNAPPFSYQFPGITCDQYEIQNIYRNIVNTIAIYGGNDPSTGLQAYGVYDDATSIAEYGAFEGKLSVPSLISVAACQSYAQVWLAQNAYPTASGTARLMNPDPTILIGNWVQFCEVPQSSSEAASIKQVRITEIDVQCVGQRVEQKLLTTSPTPYLDEAIYRLGQNVSAAGAVAIAPLTVNTQTQYIVNGGVVAAASSSPAKIDISQCQAVFASGQILAVAVGPIQVTDSVTAATGDGDYTVWVTNAGAFTITKGLPPSPSATSQQLASIAVILGTAYVTDARTLQGSPAISPSTNLALAGAVTLGTPPNAGAGAYDQPVSFSLVTPYGGLGNPSLANLQLGWRVNGASNAIAQTGALIAPNASGVYTGTAVGIGAGTAVDLFVQGIDTHGITTPWLYLTTTPAVQLATLSFPTAAMDLATGYVRISDQAVYPTAQSYTIPTAGPGAMIGAQWAQKAGSTSVSPAIWLCYTATGGGNGYFLYWSASDNTVSINKMTSGSPTRLATSTGTYAHDTTNLHTLEFLAIENTSGKVTLQAILDGVIACSATDSSSPYTAGYVAAQFRDASATNYIDPKTVQIAVGGSPSSATLNAQGNIVPGNAPQSYMEVCSPTFPVDASQVNVESYAATIYFPDGSTLAWAGFSLTTVATNGANGTWYLCLGLVLATGGYVWYASQTAPTVAQLQPFIADGVIPVIFNQTITVPAGSVGSYENSATYRHTS